MKKFLLYILLLLPFATTAQQDMDSNIIKAIIIDNTSGTYLTNDWYYTTHFNPSKDSIDTKGFHHLNSLASPEVNSELFKFGFRGEGWFLKEFQVDSSILNLPLAFICNGYAAYKIYLDGKFLNDYGTFSNKKEKGYYVNPKLEPTLFCLNRTGKHLLVLHLENKNIVDSAGQVDSRSISSDFSVAVSLKRADYAVFNYINAVLAASVVLYGIAVIFLVLSFLHFVLYLFYKKAVSNLYFGLFNFSIGILTLCIYSFIVISWVKVHDAAVFISLASACVACFSLHAFINSIHLKRKWGYWVICILSIATLVSTFGNSTVIGGGLCALLFVFTAIDAIIRIIFAMRKSVPGSKILGFGILFFFISITLMVVTISLNNGGNIHVSIDNWFGIFVVALLLCTLFSIPVSISVYLAWEFAVLNKNLQKQFQQIDTLSQKTIEQEKEKQLILENQKEHLEQEVQLRTAEVVQQKKQIEDQHTALISEKKKSDELLLNILPAEVAEELKEKGKSKAQMFDDVSVLFTDFVNFTQVSEQLGAEELVAELHECFQAFDEIMERNGMEKIKTIGDAYLAVSGMPVHNDLHAYNAIKAGLEIIAFMKARNEHSSTFEIRIGIHSGPLVAGIVGVKKFAYDIWGDTVNTASRMESTSEAGKINISEATHKLVENDFTFTYRGKIDAKHKGEIDMYFVEA